MNPTYPIREVLNLIEDATAIEMANLVKILMDDIEEYNKAEMIVINDHIIKRRIELQKAADKKN